MAKGLWDRLHYFYKQFLKTRKSGLFQMPELFVYKKWLRLSWLRAANFSSMQIIEFPSANQQRNIFDRIDYPSM